MSATVRDVAAYILARQGATTAFKLQKLCYYTQAWHLVFEGEPLFGDRIEAWANGPVAPNLYQAHRTQYMVSGGDMPGGDPTRLTQEQRALVDRVLDAYWQFEPHTLVDMTHRERPWLEARGDLGPTAPGHEEISKDSMLRYFTELAEDSGAESLE